MDRHALSLKLKGLTERKVLLFSLIAVAGMAGGAGYWSNHRSAAPKPEAALGRLRPFKTDPGASEAPAYVQFFRMLGDAFVSVQDKVDALKKAEWESERLRFENAHLRLKLEALEFSCKAQDAVATTKEMQLRLTRETGSKVGRTLAAIQYNPPGHLLPGQLFTLGVSYFRAREDEKAAVILTLLTGLEDNDDFKNPKNHLMTGIGWYRLDNLELADYYFDLVLKAAPSPETIKYVAQARLWKGLTASRLGKGMKAQYWLRELVDYHPHSREADWVNGDKEGRRATASETSE